MISNMKHIINKLSALIMMLMCVSATVQAEIVHHTVCQATPTSRGFTRECWENTETGQIYADANCTQEIVNENLAKAVIYPKLPESPLSTLYKFNYGGHQSEKDVNFYYSATTSYDDDDREARSVEFIVTGDNVTNARLVWYKSKRTNILYYGAFYVNIYVNGVMKIQDTSNNTMEEGGNVALIYVHSLPELKKGDVVKFEVIKIQTGAYDWGPTFKASLEYIGTFDNDDSPIVRHTIQEPTTSACGYSKMCWENKNTGKYYSDEACTKELKDVELAKTVLYAKFPESPITATNGFYQSEKENDWDVDLNWAGVTKYEKANANSAPRWVEFTASTPERERLVANARLVWNRNFADKLNGLYIVRVYVNNVEKFSRNQYYSGNYEGVFVLPLPELRRSDVVRFEVVQTNQASSYGGEPTFKASLEYNIVPCQHEYPAGSAICRICGYVMAHTHTYNETETCSLCGALDPTYIVMSGYVGKAKAEDIKWELTKYNVLTYTGTGEMEDFNAGHNAWRNDKKDVITKLVIGEGITKIGDSDGANGYFDKMPNLADVYLMGDKEVSAADNVFDDNVNNATLHVSNNMHKWAKTTSPWNRFGTIVPLNNYNVKYTDASGNTHEIPFDIEATDNTFTLTDGCKQLAIYEDIPLQTLTYTRNFSAANTWQALYVPFEMEYSDWEGKFDVAAINNFHEYTNNGVTEKIDLEVRYVKGGKLRANTPYLIRAKAAGVQTIVLNDVTLMATETKSIDCSSTERKYTFTGTYDAINKLKTNGYIFLSGGRLSKSNNDTDVLKPMRWYLTIEDYFSVTGNAAPALAKPISINVIGEDEATDIEDITVVSSSVDSKASGIYSITGAKLDKPQQGINIINGKKIVVK